MDYKFRAWDKDEERFWYFTLQEILERRMSYRGSWDEKVLRGDKTRWTGLMDKNGTEIYESDYIENDRGAILKVVFVDGAFYAEGIDTLSGSYVFSNLSDFSSWSKVIGNVYTMPKPTEYNISFK